MDRSERNFQDCSKGLLCEVEDGYTVEKWKKFMRKTEELFYC